MIKIAICGKMNSGKNTVASLLSEVIYEIKLAQHRHTRSNIVAFANPIKEIVMQMFPWAERDALYGSSDKRNNIISKAFDNNGNPLTYRQALNDIGTKGREYNKNNWIDVFDFNLQKAIYDEQVKSYLSITICTDVRFVNEFEYLKNEGFYNLKLVRDTVKASNHPTETEQDSLNLKDFDDVLMNNGSLEELKENIIKIANNIAS